MTLALEMRGITKRFPGVVANDKVDFQLERGEIHALLGENGAGKTTLMNILYGLYSQDEGEILLNGVQTKIDNPRDAIAQGIGMVHQHFMLAPVMTVTENIIIGNEVTRRGSFLDLKRAAKQIRELSEKYELEIDPHARVEDLPVGVRQRVEIIKALYRQADILILDEPTAVLTPQEADSLFRTMRALTNQGKSIVFITHKLKEVLQVADRITVLRNGSLVGTTRPGETTEHHLAAMMVGREVILTVDKAAPTVGETVMTVSDLVAMDDRDSVALNGLSLDVRAGEILGLAGVQGNGQTELVEVLTGLRHSVSGSVTMAGLDVTNASPRTITSQGVAHIPEDRHEHGMVTSYPIADNLILNTYRQQPFTRGVVMQEQQIVENAHELVKQFDIRTPGIFVKAGSLSGGNQQKMVVARELSRPIKLLIAAQPTRGLDVGSIEFIHGQIVRMRDQGCAVLLVSAELDEIMSLSDRIAVMYQGEIIDVLDAKEASRERLGLLMAGLAVQDKEQEAASV